MRDSKKFELKINPEIEKVAPKMSEDDFESMKDSIMKDGLLKPIDCMEDGAILDGHNKFRAYGIVKDVSVDSKAPKNLYEIDPKTKGYKYIRIIEWVKTIEEAKLYAFNSSKGRHPNKYALAEFGLINMSSKEAMEKIALWVGVPKMTLSIMFLVY